MGSTPDTHAFTLHTLGEVPRVQDALIEHARARGFPREALFAIRLALDEALTNAIRHGNGGDETKAVTVRARVTADRFEATVCDEGPGFHPADLPDPTCPENLERPHGRGVMLMRAYMTDVTFNREGNCVTLVKERGCTKPNCD